MTGLNVGDMVGRWVGIGARPDPLKMQNDARMCECTHYDTYHGNRRYNHILQSIDPTYSKRKILLVLPDHSRYFHIKRG